MEVKKLAVLKEKNPATPATGRLACQVISAKLLLLLFCNS